MPDRPSRNEEEYFALREAELQRERQRAAERARLEQERKRHFMKCPNCGADLVTQVIQGIRVGRCPECRGMWFEAREAESILKGEKGTASGIFKSLLRGVTLTD